MDLGEERPLELLGPAGALRVKVRPLTQTHCPGTRPLTIVANHVVRSRRMVHRAVIPDGEVIDVLPLVTDLQVVVLDNELHEPVEEVARLGLAETVDLLDVMASAEDALPAGDGVGANHGVDGFEELADILRRTTLGAVDLETIALSGVVEAGLSVGRSECLEELLQRLGDTVVNLVSGRPESV